MKEANLTPSIVDNQEMSKIIGTDYIEADDNLNVEDTRTLVLNTIKDNRPDLINLMTELLSEIDSTYLKGE